MQRTYHVVDVFTQTVLEGNALAVFPDARGLDPSAMQRIAREMNLSETTFVFPPTVDGAVAHVRIFTPFDEMIFAGHPTIGTAWVLRETGAVARHDAHFALEEAVGLVRIRVDDGAAPMLWLQTPPITFGETFDREQCARAIGLARADLVAEVPCRMVSAGNPAVFIPVTDAATVDRAAIVSASHDALFGGREPMCVFVFAPTEGGAYSRMFAPGLGLSEDPATGSATGPLAAFMMRHGLAPSTPGTRFVSEQGTKMGRRSLLHVLVHGEHGTDGIEIGGYVTPFATATLDAGFASG